ncbi:Zinc resistance conferring protein [Thecaphora frezii]
MASNKELRIIILLVIDIAFFFVEIITGYAVGSLALVADSFHMLNDVMSLIVALWAVKLSSKHSDHRFSYGWQRAEILGALINGVFLLALCFSIFMEAIERFINVSEVSNPKLVIIVGSLGLASNLVGLLLFHDHGHSHGGHSHAHGHGHASHSHAAHSHAHAHDGDDDDEHAEGDSAKPVTVGSKRNTAAAAASDASDASDDLEAGNGNGNGNVATRHTRQGSVSSLYGHPAQTRAFVVQTAHDLGYDSPSRGGASGSGAAGSGERSRLLGGNSVGSYGAADHDHDAQGDGDHDRAHDLGHDVESGAPVKPKKGGLFGKKSKRSHGHPEGHAHSHGHHGHSHGGHSHEGSMNMRGVFLHVLGDALGNVGVIAAGAFILYSDAPWRFYSDPLISFIITIIIFHSALPLVKSASFILLQGVPTSVSLESVRQSIQDVDGVLNLHELHVWQLSESKIVASVHVLVDCSSNQNEKYMEIAAEIRAELHSWGIHSSTIQPEFVPGGLREAARISGVEVNLHQTDAQGRLITNEGSLVEDEVGKVDTACLIACGNDDSCKDAGCCPPPATAASAGGSGSSTPKSRRAS